MFGNPRFRPFQNMLIHQNTSYLLYRLDHIPPRGKRLSKSLSINDFKTEKEKFVIVRRKIADSTAGICISHVLYGLLIV